MSDKTAETPQLFSDTNVTMKTGHLVNDAQLVAEGRYVKIRLASNKQYLNGHDDVETYTNYFNALVSSKIEEAFSVAQSLKKGDWVYLKGEDSTKSFDTPEGFKQTASTIFAYKVVLKKEKQPANDVAHASAGQAAPIMD